MKLLIVTQVVDIHDPILGFFHEWIRTFANEWDHIEVVCLKSGVYDLPPHVTVTSLGKESGGSRMRYIARFYRHIIRLRNEYDAVFIHMNPEYVVLGGVVWRLMGKQTGLWYTHSTQSLWLRIAEKMAHRIFTASVESFPIASRKVAVVGHGIVPYAVTKNKFDIDTLVRIITVGRISPRKRIDRMIEVLALLRRKGVEAELEVVGGVPEGQSAELLSQLQSHAQKENVSVIFRGPLSHEEVPAALRAADIFLNMSETGSLDKAILEAMAVQLPVVTSNVGCLSITHVVDPDAQVHSVDMAVQRIMAIVHMSSDERRELGVRYATYIASHHTLSGLAKRIRARYA